MSRIRFLHLADVHLGATPYHHPERTRDFFRALHHVVVRHAIEDPVDFVVVAGDLFDKRNIEPRVLTHATVVFSALKEAGIPVFAIEGNHDRSGHSQQVTWLRYLSDWGWIHLLEPDHEEDGTLVLRPWSEAQHSGGYLEYKGVRIVGSRWYGASTSSVIQPLADAIKALEPAPYTVLMFHTGLEGYLDHYSGAVSARQLEPFREAGVSYLALGHIHMRYEEGGWIYNPGSLESGNIAEYLIERGAYRVEVDLETRSHIARHLSDHPQRPFHRMALDVTPYNSPAEVLAAAEALVAGEAAGFRPRWPTSPEVERPVVELALVGRLGFKRHELELAAVEALLVKHCDPLVPRIRYDAVPVEYAVAPDAELGLDRAELERRVVRDLVARDARYQEKAEEVGRAVIALKQLAISGTPAAEIAETLDATMGELV